MSKQLRFGLVGIYSEWLADNISQVASLEHYSSINLIDEQLDLILLNPERPEQQHSWLVDLRTESLTSSQLILTLTSQDLTDAESSILLDGHWEFCESAEKAVRENKLSKMMFKANDPEPLIQRTLSYLWTYKARQLMPLRNWKCSNFYRYPILDCIAGNPEQADLLLSRMSVRKLLFPQRILDRIRCCTSCNSSHLSYIDQCPTCASIDIVQQPAIHCFNCGHVAIQSYFRSHGVLQCPNCLTRLRHIGSDYDRPLEQYSCRNCHSIFMEPDIRAQCMACSSSSRPEDLQLDIIENYILSNEGKLLCSLGQSSTELATLDTLKLIPPDIFRFNLGWFDDMATRDHRLNYSVMAIRLANVSEMISDHGYHKFTMVIQALSEQVRAHLRKTDLATRTANDLYLLLLLNTDSDGISIVERKILSTLEISQMDSDTKIRVIIASRSVDHGNKGAVDIDLLLEDIVNEVVD
jgi:GGDEF domain-containing protein